MPTSDPSAPRKCVIPAFSNQIAVALDYACILEAEIEIGEGGRNVPKSRQSREPEPSIINQKTIADFTRVVEQTQILEREPLADKVRPRED